MLDYHEMMIIVNQMVIQRQMNLKRVENKDIKKLTRNRIVKYIDNIFIHEDKSIEINFKEDINTI